MNQKEFFQRKRNNEQKKSNTFNSYVSEHHHLNHIIQTEIKGDNKYAILQNKRNFEDLKKNYLDNLNQRKQNLITLYNTEQNQLMAEFEEMKRHELVNQYNEQSNLIDKFKKDVNINNEKLRENARNTRIKNNNEVRREQMHQENLRTAEYNKFTKEKINLIKKDEEIKEKNYQDFLYLNNYEEKCKIETENKLSRMKINHNYSNQLKGQIVESSDIRIKDKKMQRDAQLELLTLEESQIELEKRLKIEKKQAQKEYLLKTINENKDKIEIKNIELKKLKKIERDKMLHEQQLLQEEAEKNKQIKIEKKQEMKDDMAKQLKQQAKKEEDIYELDKLANIEANKKNIIFDKKEKFKVDVRSQLIQETTMANQEILKEKNWKQIHEHKQVVHDREKADFNRDIWEQTNAMEKNNCKYGKNILMQDLRYMMKNQCETNVLKDTIEMDIDKQAIKDHAIYDEQVDDIIYKKRKVMDKLREQRPF